MTNGAPPLAAKANRSLQSAALVLDAEIPSDAEYQRDRTAIASAAIVELDARFDLTDRGAGQLERLGGVAALVMHRGLEARGGSAQRLERLAHLGLRLGRRRDNS